MGNESSLPTDPTTGAPVLGTANDGGIDELEEQGRAPPSSSQPQQQQTGLRTGGQRAGARMIGAVLKGVRSGGGQPQQQGGPPLDDEKARPNPNHYNNNNHVSVGVDQQSARSIDSVGSSSSNYFDANMGIPGAGVGGDVVSSHDYFAQAQQQNYFASQQQQHQQQHNPYYAQHPSGYPQQHGQHQLPPPPPQHHTSSSVTDVDHRDHPVVGIMYETTPPTIQKKSMFPGRATARGAALISSMRNLTLGGALRGGTNKKEVNDWEKQWDADEDDSDEEDYQDETRPMEGGVAAEHNQASVPQHHRQLQVIPPMDVGHSDLPLQHLALGSAGIGTGIANGAGMHPGVGVATALETPSFATASVKTPFVTPPDTAPQQDLASEWDMAGIQPPTAVIAPESVKDDELAKPDVTMFLPMLRVLGKGSFGKVVLVQKRQGKERGGLFAMKILRKTHLVKRRQIERTRTERKVLSVVNHPFIMKLHYAFQSHDKLYLVLDYCPGGELFFHLSRFRRFPERVARFYAAELLLAIGHLHKRGIIYRDLKPENVLLDAEGHVKLGDFGLAKAGIKHPCEGATSMCGTPEYMAPEVLGQAGHGFCVDYWGLGMLLYEMMTGLPPWYTTDRAKLFRRLKSAPLDIPSYFSVPAANCVSALLERNPRRRLGVTGIRYSMEHEFFRNISWKSLYARRVEAPIRPCEGWRPPDASQGEDENNLLAGYGGPMPLNEAERMNSNDLDAATANFDNTFTRMPVESEDMGNDGENMDESEAAEQLNEETFLGFSFDSRDRDPTASHGNGMSGPSVATNLRMRSQGGAVFSARPNHTLE